MKYNFKDKYFDQNGIEVGSAYNEYFFSTISPYGDGTRSKPYSVTQQHQRGGQGDAFVIGNGLLNSTFYLGDTTFFQPNVIFVGSGIGNTVFDGCHIARSANTTAGGRWVFKDVSLVNVDIAINFPNPNITLYKCDLTLFNAPSPTFNIYNCILRVDWSAGNNITYIDLNGISLKNSALNLYKDCDVIITDNNIQSLANNYIAFDNCRYQIGNETSFTVLNGVTESDIRNDFVARCQAQGINVPDVTDYGETLKQGRWIFSNNSCEETEIIKDSVINNFEKRRFVYFGYSDMRGDKIPITVSRTIPGSFTQEYADEELVVADDSISIAPDVDIFSIAHFMEAIQKPMALFGIKQINWVDIVHNFPKEYGIFVDSTGVYSIIPTHSGDIEEGETYIVISGDSQEATVTYNNVVYSSDLTKKNRTFRGVSGVTVFDASENATVHQVISEVMHQTIRMRIVDRIPDEIITPDKQLVRPYWYLVEHATSQNNTTDYVTYNGVNYYAKDTFKVIPGQFNFTASSPNIHLRRMWDDEFHYNTEEIDKDFWTDKQKPLWFSVLPDDMRCLKKNNSAASTEMMPDDIGTTYIASGHIDFYNSILGVSGSVLPSFPITGAYIQLGVSITTKNPI